MPDREFTIHEFSDFTDAANAMLNKSFDICLVDYKLGGATAKDFVHKTRDGNARPVPIIVISGYSETGLDADFLNNEVFDFLNKDELNSQLLTRSIDYVLERALVREVFTELDS